MKHNAPNELSDLKLDFKRYTGRGVRVAVIDSGCNPLHPSLRGLSIEGFSFASNGKNLTAPDEWSDKIGHGTACAAIVASKAPAASLCAIKVFDTELFCTMDILVKAIGWAVAEKWDLINLSLGTSNLEYREKLQSVCRAATERGVIIVAADHNEGRLSLPAHLDSVFGVAAGKIHQRYGYYYRRGNSVELIGQGDRQRLAWSDPPYVFRAGNSFAAPHITGIIALILEAFPGLTIEELRHVLEANALPGLPELIFYGRPKPSFEVYAPLYRFDGPDKTEKGYSSERAGIPRIHKAVLYPYSGEMRSLVRFKHMVDFEICAVLEEPCSSDIHRDAGEVIGVGKSGIQIKSMRDAKVAMKSADTLIIGHTEGMTQARERQVITSVASSAVANGKRVFSLQPISEELYPTVWRQARENQVGVFYPRLDAKAMDDLICVAPVRREEMRTPVIGVFSTSSGEGGFATQLVLRQILRQNGFNVGQIGTEHHSGLFGFDFTFPMRCRFSIDIPVEWYLPFLRRKMSYFDSLNYDVIIVGGQSPIVPFGMSSHEDRHVLPKIGFLYGTLPDVCILVVNAWDTAEHITENVVILRALGKCETILLVLNDSDDNIRCDARGKPAIAKGIPRTTSRRVLHTLEVTQRIPTTEVASKNGQELLFMVVDDALRRRIRRPRAVSSPRLRDVLDLDHGSERFRRPH